MNTATSEYIIFVIIIIRIDFMSYILTWSGGKDGCLAYYKALQKGYKISTAVIFIKKEDRQSITHSVSTELIRLQAKCLGIPLVEKEITGWEFSITDRLTKLFNANAVVSRAIGNILKPIYAFLRKQTNISLHLTMYFTFRMFDVQFKQALKSLVSDETEGVISGDLHPHFNGHLAFMKRIYRELGTKAVTPLIGLDREQNFLEFLDAGFEAIIVNAKTHFIDKEWVGRKFDLDFLKYLKKKNIDIYGGNGEYHTFVINGPLFKNRIRIVESRLFVQEDRFCLDIMKYSIE